MLAQARGIATGLRPPGTIGVRDERRARLEAGKTTLRSLNNLMTAHPGDVNGHLVTPHPCTDGLEILPLSWANVGARGGIRVLAWYQNNRGGDRGMACEQWNDFRR